MTRVGRHCQSLSYNSAWLHEPAFKVFVYLWQDSCLVSQSLTSSELQVAIGLVLRSTSGISFLPIQPQGVLSDAVHAKTQWW